jgi:prolyl oligopeptidase
MVCEKRTDGSDEVQALALAYLVLRAAPFALLMELGNPQNPTDARVLHAYSPYHNVREGPYPAALLQAGENDPRCPPWHARKMAARLQAANRSDRPILLRVWRDAGHVGASRTIQLDQAAEWLAFVMRELGMPHSQLRT